MLETMKRQTYIDILKNCPNPRLMPQTLNNILKVKKPSN